MLSNEKNKRKGHNFFILWIRYVIIRKLTTVIKEYQDLKCTHPEQALFPFTKINNQRRNEKINFVPYYRFQGSNLLE